MKIRGPALAVVTVAAACCLGKSGFAGDTKVRPHEIKFAGRIGNWYGVKLRDGKVTVEDIVEHLNHVRPIHPDEKKSFRNGFMTGHGGRIKRAEKLWDEIWAKSQPRAKGLEQNGKPATYEFKDGYWYGKKLAKDKLTREEVVRHLRHVAPLSNIQETNFVDGFTDGHGTGGKRTIRSILKDVHPDKVPNP